MLAQQKTGSSQSYSLLLIQISGMHSLTFM